MNWSMVQPETFDCYRRHGFVVLPGVLARAEQIKARREARAALARSSPAARSQKREWAPLLDNPATAASKTLVAAETVEIATRFVGAPVVGVMADANRVAVDTSLHADADGLPYLRGVRFNIYLSEPTGLNGALQFVVPSKSDEAAPHTLCAVAQQGDVVAFDITAQHFVSNTRRPRLFTSLIYYAQPRSDAERESFRQSLLRTLRAPKYFLQESEDLGERCLNMMAAQVPEWEAFYKLCNTS